jgi:nicotinate-nucleotide adenylyltransferase
MSGSRRIGILGGMFDPIHQGHLDTGVAAHRVLQLTTLLVAPSNVPPHRAQPVASSYHRFAMVALAIAGRSGWRATDFELSRAARSYTSDTLQDFHAAGFRPTELYFIMGADAFLEIATWKDYPALLDHAHFAVVARPGLQLASLPARLPALVPRMRMLDTSAFLHADRCAQPDAATPGHDVDPSPAPAHRPVPRETDSAVRATSAPDNERTCVFLIDAPTADVSSSAIRQARHDHRSIAGMVPNSVRQHIDQHALYEQSPPVAGVGAR